MYGVRPLPRHWHDSPADLISGARHQLTIAAPLITEELGWELRPPGRMQDWDGLMAWFLEHVRQRTAILSDLRGLAVWHRPAEAVLAEVAT